MKVNYSKVMEKTIEENENNNYVPKLLLHSCCAPCSSAVIDYLSDYFHITVLFFNPNITDYVEYKTRFEEQKKFIENFQTKYKVDIMEGNYVPEAFFCFAKNYAKEPEGGQRCAQCYKMRLLETAEIGMKLNYDYFTTTLSISPLKNAEEINLIGKELEEAYGIKFLYSDFKKKEGYKKSVELSKKYSLYRQDYCGCIYSKNNRK